MAVPVSSSDILSAAALLLSAYATWKTLHFNERQKSLIESQERLNNLLLEQGQNEARDTRKADLSASFIKLGSNKHRLKIWNKGKSPAHNVRIEFPEGNDTVVQSEIDEKFPLETLEQFQSVELIASFHFGTKSKHHIKLMWDDELSANNTKSVYPTI